MLPLANSTYQLNLKIFKTEKNRIKYYMTYDILINSFKLLFLQISNGARLDPLTPITEQMEDVNLDESAVLGAIIYLQIHHGIKLPEDEISLSMTPADIVEEMLDHEPLSEPELTDFTHEMFAKLTALFE